MATAADFHRIGNYARVKNPQQNIDRSRAHRTVPMEVLCLGYSRTGTLSMHKAMTVLGYPNPYHFSSILDNVVECDLWLQALNAKFHGQGDIPGKPFWDALLGHVGAVTDAPCILFAKELLAAYPAAKVVLVERDLESWFVSWMAFCRSAYDPVIHYLGYLDPYFLGRIAAVGDAITGPQAGFATNLDEVRVRSKDAYRHHYRDVRELVPEARLLEFGLEQGWEPLCEFLGKAVPDEPFPHENEKEANKLAFTTIGLMGLKNILRNAVVVATAIGVPVAAMFWYLRSR
ncbi:hypothetical protein LTR36_005473 [Oleoguttula mirabilis]|uniref:P-loop containing nucleoside triphosphate hydrolase protein n=1 Tax=Oleoguttula mirabilis TaxID=1507867 RepID=A0AAV9JEY2_9PEZI|nr:hypothetical protein LTR36_005473 [Oleoguttula mirabilis]